MAMAEGRLPTVAAKISQSNSSRIKSGRAGPRKTAPEGSAKRSSSSGETLAVVRLCSIVILFAPIPLSPCRISSGDGGNMAIAAIPHGKSWLAAPGQRPRPRHIFRVGIGRGHYHGDALLD